MKHLGQIVQLEASDEAERKFKPFEGMSIGTFESYSGEVTFSKENLKSYVANTKNAILSTKTSGGEIIGLPIDQDAHDYKGGAGWIVDVNLSEDGNKVLFTPKWTKVGIDLIENNLSRFFSPTLDTHIKVIMGGSLTNWPATRDMETGRIQLKPVELSFVKAFEKEHEDMENEAVIQKLDSIPAQIVEGIGKLLNLSKPKPEPEPKDEPNEEETQSELEDQMKTPAAVLELGRLADEKAKAMIAASKRKQHVVEFAATLVGGTRERPFGIPGMRADEITTLLLSLPEKQALKVEKLLSKALDGAIDFAERGISGDGFFHKPQLPDAVQAYARQWVKAGKPIAEFFVQNPEVGKAEDYDLAEFVQKEK